MHWRRWKLYGSPFGRLVIRGDDEARFWSYVDQSGEHWLWTGALDRDGYGRFRIGRTHTGAHRYAFELANGPLGPGLMPDHLCRVRSCVRWTHLEAVTNAVNLARGREFSATQRQGRGINS